MTENLQDIRKEKLIAKKWDFISTPASIFPEGILLTGASSFVGCHLVKELQKEWNGPVYLLLRANTNREAEKKMHEAFAKWELGSFKKDRYEIVTGDVTRKHFGLPYKTYKRLMQETGRVIHLAMTPMYHLPYEHFRRIWVPELERMIEFCGNHHSPKSLHYTSSFNANFFTDDHDFKALNTNAWQSGYAGFKYVANKALENAFRQGMNGCIYDLPLVLGSEGKGVCPRHYSIWLILDMFLKTGFYFKFHFRVIPVDVLAEIMVFNIMREAGNVGSSFVRPALEEPVSDLMFSRMAANLLGLHEGSLETVRDACQNKLRFNFMVPGNFYELLEKVSGLEQVLPGGYDPSGLPKTSMVFLSNLNRILARNTELKVEI